MDGDKIRSWLVIYLKGFAMGSADAVPGVSGGTIALITGIYERLIDAITGVDLSTFRRSMENLSQGNLEGFEKVFSDHDGYFLAVLGLGVVSALVLVLRLIHYLIQQLPVPTFGFFFGLIAFSVVVLWRQVDISGRTAKLSALAGFLAAFLTSGYAASSLGHSLPVVFLAGIIASSAMILPGISGSLLLIILGQYEYMTGALTRFTDALLAATSGNFQKVVEAAPPVLVFISGAGVGLLAVSHTVKKALENHRKATMAFLISLVAGALRAPVIQVEKVLTETGSSWPTVLPGFAAAAVFGALAIYLLDRKAGII